MSEKKYVMNMLDQFAKPGAIFAMVADSYDVFKFCEMIGNDSEIKKRIEDHGKTGGFVVIRPDSGDPVEVNTKLIQILDNKFGSTVNSKGYKVLNYVRIIQGDGINYQSIDDILTALTELGYSADNIAFGMGGALLQQLDRDTQKFAMKASSVCINGEWVAIAKDPVTDPGKKSKAGRVTLWRNGSAYISSVKQPSGWHDTGVGEFVKALETVFDDGVLVKEINFDQVRANSRI